MKGNETVAEHHNSFQECRLFKGKHYGSHGKSLRGIRRKPKGNKEKDGTSIAFAYTQKIVRLYAKDRVPIHKRLCAYTQIKTHFKTIIPKYK
jgi:hypothetical protein